MAFSRRAFVQTTGGAALFGLGGCTSFPIPTDPDAPEITRNAIDIHAHFFNGKDIPVRGFLRQIFLQHQKGSDSDDFLDGLLELAKSIIFSGTPGARQEYRKIRSGHRKVLSSDAALAIDEQRVQAGLQDYIESAERRGNRVRALAGTGDPLLDQLHRELAPERPGGPQLRSVASARGQAEILARAAFERSMDDVTKPRFAKTTSLPQTLRWIGLLTRSRINILAEYKRHYGRPGNLGVRIVSPSIVDLNSWLTYEHDHEFSSLEDQIDVMSALARSERDIIILNFVPFCPLRAALERDRGQGGKSLDRVSDAIRNKGFCGVKIYPPMGFAPWGNAGRQLVFGRKAPKGGGRAVDRELMKLYEWCVANDVPIKAHANNSIAASPCSGLNASPANWAEVFRQPGLGQLRLNLAHFGGFEESSNVDPCLQPDSRDWEVLAVELAADAPGVFFDLGYWNEIGDPGSAQARKIVGHLAALRRKHGEQLASRLMFGTDFVMLGRETAYANYLANTRKALLRSGFRRAQLAAIERDNALRFLGLKPGSKRVRRLVSFFGREHPFSAMFA